MFKVDHYNLINQNEQILLFFRQLGNFKMGKNLYVGNLPYSLDDNQLKDLFSEAGSVTSATIITDKMSGRSKGFGFVEMGSDEEAAKAIEMFNEKEVEGRNIKVNEARPREER